MMKKILFAIIFAICGLSANAQQVALSTDVLKDLLMTPNAGIELVVGERSTIGGTIFGNYKPWGQDMKMEGVQGEYRYFFSGRPMHKFFVGASALALNYDITWKGKVYDGISLGAGVTFGYVINLTNRLNLDCHAGFGALVYRQKEYYEGDNAVDATGHEKYTNAKGYYLLPTRIGVSLSYILK